jgi:DNA-binding helix-hairpin-helix protein with protein kinase domain
MAAKQKDAPTPARDDIAHLRLIRDKAKRTGIAPSWRASEVEALFGWIEALERGISQMKLLEGLPLPAKVVAAVEALAQEAESAGACFEREVERHCQNPASIGAPDARDRARDLRAKVDAVLTALPCIVVEKDR